MTDGRPSTVSLSTLSLSLRIFFYFLKEKGVVVPRLEGTPTHKRELVPSNHGVALGLQIWSVGIEPPTSQPSQQWHHLGSLRRFLFFFEIIWGFAPLSLRIEVWLNLNNLDDGASGGIHDVQLSMVVIAFNHPYHFVLDGSLRLVNTWKNIGLMWVSPL